MTKNGYRLPTAAEWEYAGRGGKELQEYDFAGGNDPAIFGWFYNNSENHTHPVNTNKDAENTDSSNILGIYDMCGNVNEWVWDWAYPSTVSTSTPVTGPDMPSSVNSRKRAKRGGGWDSKVTSQPDNAAVWRNSSTNLPYETATSSADHQTVGLGFRVVRTVNSNY